MAGLVPIGESPASGDITTGANIDRGGTHSQNAVDRRAAAVVPVEMAKSPAIAAALLAGVSDAVAGMNLVEATKGIIPVNADLNTYNTLDHVGGHQIGGAINIYNRPEGFTKTGLLEVWRAGAFAVVQRATNSDGSWFRETHLNESDWGPWRKLGEAAVVSTDRLEPITDGQTLFVYDGNAAATDFSIFPAGFFGYWGSTWKANDTALLDGQGVTYSGAGITFLAWNQYTSVTDIEMVTRAAITTINNTMNGGLIARASDAGGYQGIVCFVANLTAGRSLAVAKYVNGVYSLISRAAFDVEAGEPYMIRLKIEGTTVQARAWLASAPEPDGWMIGVTDDAMPASGRMGLFQNSGGVNAWDYLSVNVGGGSA